MTHRYLITQGPIYKVSCNCQQVGEREKKSTGLSPCLKSNSMSRSYYSGELPPFWQARMPRKKPKTKIPVLHATLNIFLWILLYSIKPQPLQVLNVLLDCIQVVTETKILLPDKTRITIHFVWSAPHKYSTASQWKLK